MGVLDQVMQLKQQGMNDTDIANDLQQKGISPKEITDAMNQAQIKNAVADTPGAGAPPNPAEVPPQAAPAPGAGAPAGDESYYTPQTQEIGATYAPAQAAPAEYYEEGAYPAAGTGAATTGMDTDTIIEIANQVFSEKMKKTQSQIEDITELKTMVQVKVDNMDTRLKRIEKIIDTLQIKVLEKVGSFGRDISSTKKEVAMVENSLGKIVKSRVAKPKTAIRKTTRKTNSRKRK